MSPPEKDRRRSKRLPLQVPVVLQGTDAAGRRFFERAEMVSLDAHGGRARTRFLLEVGAEVTLLLPAEDRAKRLRVVWRGESNSSYEGMIGLEFVDPEESWNLESLRARWGARRF